MSFSRRALGLFLVAILSISGCGLNTGEKPPEENAPAFSGKGYSCVGQIPQHLERYVADELNETEISDFVRCLQKAFTSFTQLTRGKDQSTYTPEEIRRFLQTYFLRERPITNQLMHEFMVLKQVIVGGKIDFISRPELSSLIDLLEDFRVEAIRLKPHLKYLNPRLAVNQDPDDVGLKLQTAYAALSASIKVLSSRLEKGTRIYPFDNMQTLIGEFRNFVRWDDHFGNAHSPVVWVNFFKAFKRALVTPNDSGGISPAEWAPFLGTLSRWYLAFVEYQIGVKSQPKLYGVGLQNTMHLGKEIFDLLEQSVERHGRQKVITFEQINFLIAAIQDLKWLPVGIRAESVEKVLRALLTRVFPDDVKGPLPKKSSGLTQKSLALMRYEFYRWAYIQMQMNSRYRVEVERDGSKISSVPSLQANFFTPLDARHKAQSVDDSDWDHFLKIRQLTKPLFNNNLSRITLVPAAQLDRYHLAHDFSNLSMMNLFRSAVGLLFRGYGSEVSGTDWDSGIKSEELQAFYLDFRDLAIDLGLADRRLFNTGARAFVEGNLFTYSADGLNVDIKKSRLNYVETMELLAFLYSGGMTSRDYYSRLAEICPHGPVDQNGEVTIGRACATKELLGLVKTYSRNLPGLVGFLESTSSAKQSMVIENLIATAYSPHTSQADWVERSELGIVAVVLHYLEAVMTRFDKNQDGKLTNKEIRAAIPVFTGYIQRFAKEQMKTELSEREAQGVFIYILAYKNIPNYWNLLKVYDFSVDWYWEYEIGGLKLAIDLNQTIALDRAELSQVFKAIVSKIFETSPNAKLAN